jgi:SAM-dependent methyltransferase
MRGLALPARAASAVRARGLRPVLGDLARWGAGVLAGLPWTLTGSHGQFTFGGEGHRYRFHRYKLTWLTERAVEVPIVQAIVDRHAGERILEVGNVLSHYRPQSHVVVDKYERAPGVLNRDVLELDDLGPFDLVVAISTIEHVGWDEEPRDPGKALEAVRRLEALLAPGGRLVLTVPVGYHPGLDAALRAGAVSLSRAGALRRDRIGPHWREVAPEDAWGTPYDFLLYSARAVVFGVIERPAA